MSVTSGSVAASGAHRVVRPRRDFRPPLLARLFSVIGTIVLASASALLIGFGVLLLLQQWGIALFMAATGCFLGGLTGYVWRDLAGKWGLHIVLDADAVTLDLPSGRSLINRPPEQHLTIPYDDIAAIETRLEAYGGFGLAIQRPYVLRRKAGALIFLFEDRALGSGMEWTMFADVAQDLATRAGVKIHDLGMVEGGAGFLGVWGTHAVDWAAPSLPLARQLRIWRHAATTGTLALGITIFALVLRVLVGG